jgi:hypothetical protein
MDWRIARVKRLHASDQCPDLKPISFAVVVRSDDRHRIGMLIGVLGIRMMENTESNRRQTFSRLPPCLVYRTAPA